METGRENIVTLIDESGKDVLFEHLDTVLYQDKEYVLLLPIESAGDRDEDDEGVVILRIIRGNEEDTYENVEDDDLLDAVFEQYLGSMEETE